MCLLWVRQMSAPCTLLLPFNFNLPHHHLFHRRNSYKGVESTTRTWRLMYDHRRIYCSLLAHVSSVFEKCWLVTQILFGRTRDFSVLKVLTVEKKSENHGIITPTTWGAIVWNCQTAALTEHSDTKILEILADLIILSFIEAVKNFKGFPAATCQGSSSSCLKWLLGPSADGKLANCLPQSGFPPFWRAEKNHCVDLK